MARRVVGFAAHASFVDGKIIRYKIGADNDQRVDGKAVHPTISTSPAQPSFHP